MATLTWTASNGSVIEIEAKIGIGGAVLVARIDGKQVASVYGITVHKSPIVHSNGQTAVAAIGNIGLNAERYDAARTMLEVIKAEYAKTSDGLGETRRTLVAALNALRAEADHAARLRINRAMSTGVDKRGVDLSAKEQSAADALAVFDAAHPEIIDAIRADRSAAAKRFAETD